MVPPDELRVNAGVVWLAGNAVWSTPERIRGEVLTTMRYTNRRLPYPFTLEACPLKYVDLKSLNYIVVGSFMKIFKQGQGGRYLLYGDVQLPFTVGLCWLQKG